VVPAAARGLPSGVAATTRHTPAPPPSYSAHIYQRGQEAEIASLQRTQGFEVPCGGGRNQYLPEALGGRRTDARNLLDEARERGYTVVEDRAAFEGLQQTPVLGLFAPDMMAYEIDRDPAEQPSLSDMTAKAIELLSEAPQGFFLMVEGSRIDHAAPANDAAAHLHDILAFNAAVAGALDFAARDGQTLVVSTSDHETGGLTIGRSVDGRAVYAWEPEVLARVQHSNEYMGRQLLRGDSLEDVIRGGTGLEDITGDETAALEGAFDGTNSAPVFRLVTEMVSSRAVLGWTTTGHTAVDVNLYAYGPGSDHFRGNHDNTYIGKALADLLGFDLEALTARLRAEN
jgi:alkaline phosphatase